MTSRGHDVLQLGVGRDDEQLPQGENPHQVVVLVGDVDVEDHLHILGLLQRGDRLPDGQVLLQGEDLRRHDAAGGVLLVLEQLLDLLRVFILHDVEDLFGEFLGHVADDVDGIVVGHLLENLGDGLLFDLLQELGAGAVIELGKDVGRGFGLLDEVEEDALFLQIEIAEKMGDVGGMGLGEDLGEVGKGAAADEFPDRIEEYLKFLVHGARPSSRQD